LAAHGFAVYSSDTDMRERAVQAELERLKRQRERQ
jgi:hypothetical protein